MSASFAVRVMFVASNVPFMVMTSKLILCMLSAADKVIRAGISIEPRPPRALFSVTGDGT